MGSLVFVPAAAILLGVALDSAAPPIGLDPSTANRLTLLLIGSTLVLVPAIAFRWTRSLPKTIGATAAAFLLAAAIVFILIVALLASVGETEISLSRRVAGSTAAATG